MRLSDVIRAMGPLPSAPAVVADPDIRSVHYRAQDVTRGGLFVAIPGFRSDGHDFVDEAVRRGAAAVLAGRPVEASVPVVRVEDPRRAMAAASAAVFGHPSRRATLVGVTGTNGKTTVSYLLESILAAAGHRVGVIGTVEVRYGDVRTESARTTPESPDLQKTLADMVSAGVTHVVLEVASHGIELGRVDHVAFDAAVFTNLSQDHLDFHGDMERYWACKRRLFTELLRTGPKSGGAVAVVHRDDPRGDALFPELSGPALSVGISPGRDIHVLEERCDAAGIRAAIRLPGGRIEVTSPLVGRHNLQNLLCAAGAAVALGVAPKDVAAGLNRAPAAPGRLEAVADPAGRFVYVDYAHTPDALENVLNALGRLKTGRLICVFGCGGDRDRRKRPRMGAIATRLSDLAVVTSDNPRSEAPMTIIKDILEGIDAGAEAVQSADAWRRRPRSTGVVVEPDRREAIGLAIAAAAPGDIVLVAGKGHETYQIVGERTLPFDDRKEVAAALRRAVPSPAGGVRPQ